MRPEDIKNRTFANALRGYDKDEVRSFLFRVAESSRELHEKLTATEAQLTSTVADESQVEASDVDTISGDFGDLVVGEAAEAPSALSGSADATHDDTGTPDTQGFAVEPVDAAFEAPVVDSVPVADAFVEAPVESLASAEQSIADRYGAIGDRIADLLRNADESAAQILAAAEHDSAAVRSAAETEATQIRTDAEERASQLLAESQSIRAEADAYRDEVMAELANARLEQESALQEARTAAEAEVETFRVDSIAEITSLRSDAFVEIDELRSGANTEIAELRSVAQADAEALREATLSEATASIEADAAAAARLKEEAEIDRIAARAELDDVRSEVSTLLEQARTQSEFIKQEADEIIRTKVRANFEQAQARIDVLRNTEVASRERIVLAQTELASALTRLDSEPVPELDPSDSPAVIEEAVARHDEIAATQETFEVEAGDVSDAVVDSPVIDTDVVEADVVAAEPFEAGAGFDSGAAFDSDAAFEADEAETDDVEFSEGDGPIAAEGVGDGALSTYFAPGDDDASQTTGDILAGAFGSPTVDSSAPEATADGAWPATEFVDVESVEYETASAADVAEEAVLSDSPQFETTEPETTEPETSGFETTGFEVAEIRDAADDAPATLGGFDVVEHVVVESADYGDLPVRGEGTELPVRGQTPSEVVDAAPTSFGASSLADALPAEDAPELGGASQEDALARLVREAMQEAVDSARKND